MYSERYCGSSAPPRPTCAPLPSCNRLAGQVDGETYVACGAYLECDRAFHAAIVRMLGDQRLMALYEEINLPLWLVRAQEHDPVAAAEAMTAHIEGSVIKLGVKLGLTRADHVGRAEDASFPEAAEASVR